MMEIGPHLAEVLEYIVGAITFISFMYLLYRGDTVIYEDEEEDED